MTYLVTGYPRSGTAWVANFLTTDGHACHHEALPTFTREAYARIDGNADSGALVFLDDLEDAPIVLIDRPLDDVAASLKAIGLFDTSVYALEEHFHRALERADLVVPYATLFGEGIREIWRVCRGTVFPEDRLTLLRDMRVTATENAIWRRAYQYSCRAGI